MTDTKVVEKIRRLGIDTEILNTEIGDKYFFMHVKLTQTRYDNSSYPKRDYKIKHDGFALVYSNNKDKPAYITGYEAYRSAVSSALELFDDALTDDDMTRIDILKKQLYEKKKDFDHLSRENSDLKGIISNLRHDLNNTKAKKWYQRR